MSMDIKGYETLASVLQAAYDQAAMGKGAERHATGLPFDQQPMQTGSDLLGTDAGLAFQAIKKIREGRAFEEYDRFERELLGAIVYIAGMIIWRQRQQDAKPPAFDWSGALDEQETAAPSTCPFCSAPEGSMHYPDCYLMRRGKPRLAAGGLHPDFAATLREKGLVQAAVASVNGQTGDVVLEPATQIDDESDRQKAVQQSGNDGAVYDDPWYGAPEWARFKAQDSDGEWRWFEGKPTQGNHRWHNFADNSRVDTAGWKARTPNWRDTLLERPVGQDPQE